MEKEVDSTEPFRNVNLNEKLETDTVDPFMIIDGRKPMIRV